MKRRLFNLLAAISLVLCVATAVLWVRSYWMRTNISRVSLWQTGANWHWASKQFDFEHGYCIWSDESYLVTDRSFADTWKQQPGKLNLSDAPSRDSGVGFPKNLWFQCGWKRPIHFGSVTNSLVVQAWFSFLQFPLWAPFLLSSVLPAVWMRRFRREQRLRQVGHCRVCGYDLRATPDRCPECGTEQKSEARGQKPAEANG